MNKVHSHLMLRTLVFKSPNTKLVTLGVNAPMNKRLFQLV
jgi:hypothetical protein